MKVSLDEDSFVFHQRLILFDNHVKPCRLLVCDLAVTCHVVIDVQSSQSAKGIHENEFSLGSFSRRNSFLRFVKDFIGDETKTVKRSKYKRQFVQKR